MKFWIFVKSLLKNKDSSETLNDTFSNEEMEDIQKNEDFQDTEDEEIKSGESESDNLEQQDSSEGLEEKREDKQEQSDSSSSSSQETDSLSDSEDKKDALKNFRDILTKIKEKKEKEEKEKELEINNELKDKLKDIPSWKDRQRGGSYSIDTSYNGEIPDSVIKTLINKFLRQKFCKNKSTLNSRSTSLEKSKGYFKWDYMNVIKHLETEELTKIPLDRYDYLPAQGKNEDVPLSFYFDLSGSMSEYTGMLSMISVLLLKQNVKVLVGFNENVHVQIDSIKDIENIKDLEKLLIKFGEFSYNGEKDKIIKNKGVVYRNISENLDSYLIRKKAEKCVVFSDFDPIREVMNLSEFADVYWFCFEESFSRHDLYDKYFGFLYKVQSLEDIIKGLERVNERRFESLMYIDDENILKRRNI